MVSEETSHHLLDLVQSLPRQTVLLHPHRSIKHLLIDSRQLVDPATSLFFALAGARTDGHRFIQDLYQKGVRAFIVNQPQPSLDEADFIQVEDVLTALQQMVSWHRSQFDLPVIGITGSNGKTIVKEWLVHLLSKKGHKLAYSPRSYNSQLGVPLSVWQLNSNHDLAIFEAGISKMGEMQTLGQIIQPSLGILTNIGAAHDAGFPDRETKLLEKLGLFERAKKFIYRADDALIHSIVKQKTGQAISWASQVASPIKVNFVSQATGGAVVQVHETNQEYRFFLPFKDFASLENAAHCAITILELGLPLEDYLPYFKDLPAIGSRMEVLLGRDGNTLLNDSYSNDLTSLGLCLNFAEEQSRQQSLCLILSDIPQSGLTTNELYRQTAALISNRISQFIGVGKDIKAIAEFLPTEITQHFYVHTQDLIDDLSQLQLQDQFIILKGARQFTFEQLLVRLRARLHRAILEVDLGALVNNYRYFKKQLTPKVAIAAMVKAAAYGSGSLEVARRLEVEGVDYLVVAYTDEGVTLRKGGIQTPIMVLNVDTDSFASLQEYQLEPEIYDKNQLAALAYFTDSLEHPMKIHIKINSGMHRLGFEPGQMKEVAQLLQSHPQLRVASVLSHLSASDDAKEDSFTHQQALRFDHAYQAFCLYLGYRPIRHLLNTSGILRFPQYHHEMVRLGIGLYGLEASGTAMDQLELVLQLKARVSQVRHLGQGDTVGYGRRGKILRPTKVATLNIGYADGFPRSAGNGAYAVSIQGKLVPTIGAICMDMCMVDVTELQGLEAGEEAIIFGSRPSVSQLAEVDSTIDYEILTRISDRVPRRYIQE